MPQGLGGHLSVSMGQAGAVYITSTDEVTGDFGIIYALEAATIAELKTAVAPSGGPLMHDEDETVEAETGYGILTNVPLFAGLQIFGHFKSLTLSEGKVIAYKLPAL